MEPSTKNQRTDHSNRNALLNLGPQVHDMAARCSLLAFEVGLGVKARSEKREATEMNWQGTAACSWPQLSFWHRLVRGRNGDGTFRSGADSSLVDLTRATIITSGGDFGRPDRVHLELRRGSRRLQHADRRGSRQHHG
jgi:hypothetical protein